MLSHSVEVHPHVEFSGIWSPVFILVKVNVSTELTKLVRIVGMGQDQPRPVERITKIGRM